MEHSENAGRIQRIKYQIYLALASFCALTFFYWLTSGAHFYIADEETAYQGTEALVERGTLELLKDKEAGDAPRTVVRMPHGIYGITGPLQSILAIPFYLIGRTVAAAFPATFHGYWTRFFVALVNAPLHAATVVLLYLFSRDIGHRHRTALFGALTYGLATIAWPYSRTFYADTGLTFWLVLATWAMCRYSNRRQVMWMVIAGTAAGLGITNKYTMIVAMPALALYLLINLRDRPHKWRWLLQTGLAGGVPFALIMVALLMFNQMRFGNMFETGYTGGNPVVAAAARTAQATPLIGLYGLLFSSGKGIFFYSPPLILSFWGIRSLGQRRPKELWLSMGISISYLLFYSFTKAEWYGGGNWGPRHMVCLTPFLMLLVNEFLERRDVARWLRLASATILFVVGFWVQTSTVLVNYDTFLFSDVPSSQQHFNPAYSPLVAQWWLWPWQTRDWQNYDHALRTSGAFFYILDGGFYDVEVPAAAPFGRWMNDKGRLRIYAHPAQTLTVHITYSRPHAADPDANWPGLTWIVDGVTRVSERQYLSVVKNETRWQETLTLPASNVQVFPVTIELTATTWLPLDYGDPRALSIFVENITVLSDGVVLPFKEANLPRPLPVTMAYPWSRQAMFWFYDPRNARPFDIWAWYVWTSGLPVAQAQTFIIALTAVWSAGFLASAAGLLLMVKRSRR